ncbi:MAG: type II toxin-antitoxin system HicB family antitoxin [Armatimonadota bacterium]
MDYSYTVFLRREPEGEYTVVVPALPGCLTYGTTIAEALRMAAEAIELHVESLLSQSLPVPLEGPTLCLETENLTDGVFSRVTVQIGDGALAHA